MAPIKKSPRRTPLRAAHPNPPTPHSEHVANLNSDNAVPAATSSADLVLEACASRDITQLNPLLAETPALVRAHSKPLFALLPHLAPGDSSASLVTTLLSHCGDDFGGGGALDMAIRLLLAQQDPSHLRAVLDAAHPTVVRLVGPIFRQTLAATPARRAPHRAAAAASPFASPPPAARAPAAPRLLGAAADAPPILAPSTRTQLCAELPATHSLSDWHLLYATAEHGSSLRTLYRRCAEHSGPSVLVIESRDRRVFGAFLSAAPQPSGGSYYGNGESFLFHATKRAVHAHRWPGRPRPAHFILGQPDGLALGGGGDGFGLFIDASIDRGSSARCATYENAPLAGPGSETFEIARLECWGVGAF